MAPEIRVIKPRQVDANQQVILSYPRQATIKTIPHKDDAIALSISRDNSAQPHLASDGADSLQSIAVAEPAELPTSQRFALNKLELRKLPQLHQKGQLNDQFSLKVNGVNHVCSARSVGSLVVVWRSDLNQFQLLTALAGNSRSRDRFSTFEHCLSAAMELEQIFVMEEAIALRSSETWEAIAAVIHQHWLREQVELVLGAGQVDR